MHEALVVSFNGREDEAAKGPLSAAGRANYPFPARYHGHFLGSGPSEQRDQRSARFASRMGRGVAPVGIERP